MSSRGQVVIPQNVRQEMHLITGAKFVVIGEEDTIILKKIEMPSFKGFDKLLAKTNTFAKEKEITKDDVAVAIKQARKK